MLVRIPQYHKKSNDTLSEIVAVAADRHGLDNLGAALFVATFLELLMDEVSKGREVTIPGFGKFASYYDRRKRHNVSERKLRPRFLAATAFKQTVRFGVSPSPQSLRRQRVYTSNHQAGDTGRRSASRAFTAMNTVRKKISSQMGNVL